MYLRTYFAPLFVPQVLSAKQKAFNDAKTVIKKLMVVEEWMSGFANE